MRRPRYEFRKDFTCAGAYYPTSDKILVSSFSTDIIGTLEHEHLHRIFVNQSFKLTRLQQEIAIALLKSHQLKQAIEDTIQKVIKAYAET